MCNDKKYNCCDTCDTREGQFLAFFLGLVLSYDFFNKFINYVNPNKKEPIKPIITANIPQNMDIIGPIEEPPGPEDKQPQDLKSPTVDILRSSLVSYILSFGYSAIWSISLMLISNNMGNLLTGLNRTLRRETLDIERIADDLERMRGEVNNLNYNLNNYGQGRIYNLDDDDKKIKYIELLAENTADNIKELSERVNELAEGTQIDNNKINEILKQIKEEREEREERKARKKLRRKFGSVINPGILSTTYAKTKKNKTTITEGGRILDISAVNPLYISKFGGFYNLRPRSISLPEKGKDIKYTELEGDKKEDKEEDEEEHKLILIDDKGKEEINDDEEPTKTSEVLEYEELENIETIEDVKKVYAELVKQLRETATKDINTLKTNVYKYNFLINQLDKLYNILIKSEKLYEISKKVTMKIKGLLYDFINDIKNRINIIKEAYKNMSTDISLIIDNQATLYILLNKIKKIITENKDIRQQLEKNNRTSQIILFIDRELLSDKLDLSYLFAVKYKNIADYLNKLANSEINEYDSLLIINEFKKYLHENINGDTGYIEQHDQFTSLIRKITGTEDITTLNMGIRDILNELPEFLKQIKKTIKENKEIKEKSKEPEDKK